MRMMETITVLAGDPAAVDELYAAGCDEVIVAYDGFSMAAVRRTDSVPETAGVLLNGYFFENDMDELHRIMQKLQNSSGPVYFSDPAVLAEAEKYGMVSRLVYKPDTLAVSAPDVQWWMDRGIRSVLISPLVTLEELTAIGEHCDGCEAMIHGHLLMSASRRPLLSSRGLEKDNQELTLQEETREERYPVYECREGTLIYTDYILCSFREICTLRDHGIRRYFIDGSFLEQEELCRVIKAYRAVLNGADPEESIRELTEQYPGEQLSSGYYKEKTVK